MDKIQKLRIIGISGIILLFPNLIFYIIAVLNISEFNRVLNLVTSLLMFAGVLMVLVSTIMLNDERRKEKIKSIY